MSTSVTLLLPARARFGAQRWSQDAARAFGRADVTRVEGTQLARLFDVLPRGWPVAAVTRQRDAGDAGHATWLRADPAHVRAEPNGARLLAWGDALQLTREDTDAFLPALKPVFGDSGALLDAPAPGRWYLQMPAGAKLPAFAAPDEALGADLFEQLPGVASDDPLGRRWRTLLSEAQVMLHNHPRNALRSERGLLPVNSVWFWGAGVRPDHVRTACTHVASDDDGVRAFAAMAGIVHDALPSRWSTPGGTDAIDLRHAVDIARVDADWIAPALADMAAGRLHRLLLDFDDGARAVLERGQRWRFWRKPVPQPGLDRRAHA